MTIYCRGQDECLTIDVQYYWQGNFLNDFNCIFMSIDLVNTLQMAGFWFFSFVETLDIMPLLYLALSVN